MKKLVGKLHSLITTILNIFILEQKLQRLQNEKRKVSGKTMLEHLKEKREFHMKELMNGLDVYTDSSAAGSPSFMDKLYSTNSLYRHLNPQQALDASEKEPFVEHDQLATKHVES